MDKKFYYLLLLLLILVSCNKVNDGGNKNNPPQVITSPNPIYNYTINQSLPNFTNIYESRVSAVVTITTESIIATNKDNNGQHPLAMKKSIGSGFIISSDGYIVTSAHVITDYKELSVIFSDNQRSLAHLIGINSLLDVALIKVDLNNLPFIPLNANVTVHPGDWVMAIGSPYGYNNSLTVGIVSNNNRYLNTSLSKSNVAFIQTDVPINPGSSGGPLFNQAGQIIGMNSLIYSPNNNYSGISFALPIQSVIMAISKIKADIH